MIKRNVNEKVFIQLGQIMTSQGNLGDISGSQGHSGVSLGASGPYGVVRITTDKQRNKLGLSWAKLSYQLGFACTLTIICYIILINTEQCCLV